MEEQIDFQLSALGAECVLEPQRRLLLLLLLVLTSLNIFTDA